MKSELDYSILQKNVNVLAYLAYEAAPENVNSMRHLECSMDDTYEAAESTLACYCDLISSHDYRDNNECFIYGCYYSSKHMMEFYRLCRVHAKLLRVKLHEEPFFARAKRFVYSQLSNSYTFDYTLQTKVNREYASGIAVLFFFEGLVQKFTSFLIRLQINSYVLRAIHSSLLAGMTRTHTPESGAEITAAPSQFSLACPSSFTPSGTSFSHTIARIRAEWSPMPAINTR